LIKWVTALLGCQDVISALNTRPIEECHGDEFRPAEIIMWSHPDPKALTFGRETKSCD
jgi:hypothetical protein